MPGGCTEGVSALVELDLSLLPLGRILEVFLDRNPICLARTRTRDDEYDGSVPTHPILDISLVADPVEGGVVTGSKWGVSRLALNLHDRVTELLSDQVSNLEMPVDPCFEATSGIPHEPHGQQTLLDHVDPLLTEDRLVRNPLPARFPTCVAPHDTRLRNSSGVLHHGLQRRAQEGSALRPRPAGVKPFCSSQSNRSRPGPSPRTEHPPST